MTDYEPGLYRDPPNGDLWEKSALGTWRWINGNNWRFIPEGLVRVGDAYDQQVAK
ncbi:hypothetical protein SEA_JINKIES_70 [Arthrobacter phage Jinkies]|uniref:Uncharacterized protein n=1 Tax=Arthrobacter phage Jinkies TaxID=2743903 RepID=A0A7T0NBL5_9CAUD|nr:hypothetical protein SEA_JINKIES_70 [Arthrobacter phage Jinkies]